MATLGYCTNVHAGATLHEAKEQLDRHATAVRRELGVEWLDIGLWLSARAVAGWRCRRAGSRCRWPKSSATLPLAMRAT